MKRINLPGLVNGTGSKALTKSYSQKYIEINMQ